MTVLRGSKWSSEVPSGTSLIRKGDDEIRSDKSVTRQSWLQDHFFDDGSSNSAGVHKEGGPAVHVGPNSEVSAAGDRARLMYDSDRSALAYVGAEGVVQFGVPSRYILYHQREDDTFTADAEMTNEATDPTERLDQGKVWVASIRTCTTASRDPALGSQYSYFAGTDYGPYDGMPNIYWSVVSNFVQTATHEKQSYEVRITSRDTSNFTITGAFWVQGVDALKVDFGGAEIINIMSIGTMDASRIS